MPTPPVIIDGTAILITIVVTCIVLLAIDLAVEHWLHRNDHKSGDLGAVGPDGKFHLLREGSAWHSHWNGDGPIAWLPGKECHECEPRVGPFPIVKRHIDYDKKVVTEDVFYKNDVKNFK